MLHRRGCIIAWGGALGLSFGAAFGQGDTPGCSETYTLPAAVTVRPLDLPNPNSAGPADPDIAIGFDRIVCVTNGGDGKVGLADLLLFQRLYERGDAPADYDGNGEIDAFDFLQLLLDVQDAPR